MGAESDLLQFTFKSYEPIVYWKFVWSFMKQWSRACDRYFFCITVCKPQNDEKIPAYGMACFPCCLLYFLILCNPRHYLNSHVSEKLWRYWEKKFFDYFPQRIHCLGIEIYKFLSCKKVHNLLSVIAFRAKETAVQMRQVWRVLYLSINSPMYLC